MSIGSKVSLLVALCLAARMLPAQSKLTTIILVRHAEKTLDGSPDPDLTEAGRNRANALVDVLSKTKIDAIYSTHFKRTEQTILPLAKHLGLPIQNYDGQKMNDVDAMLKKHKGGTIVVCGHSNSTPAIANYLTGKKNELKNFDDSDYGNLLIVSVSGKEAKVTWLRYGDYLSD